MNYDWNRIANRGQEGNGYVEIYQSDLEGLRACAVVSYFPQFTGKSKERNVNVCLLFEGKKIDMTKGLFHAIYEDVGELVRSQEEGYFNRGGDALEFIITQTIIVNKLPDIELLAHGECNIVS